MISQRQEEQYISFVGCFVDQLHKAGIEQAQALHIATLGAATLLGAVFHVQPYQLPGLDEFAATVIKRAVKLIYEGEKA